MKNLIWIPIVLLIASCGKAATTTIEPSISTYGGLSEPFLHSKIKELFVVVFKKNESVTEWKRIFDLTQELSARKKQLRSIEGDDSESASVLRVELMKKNSEILNALGSASVFLMSWSQQDENCKFVKKEDTRLVCKPRNRNNPMNGGLPLAVGPVEWLVPVPARTEVKSPYLRIVLEKARVEDSILHYQLELRLKAENRSESETWLKGDAIPSAQSVFVTDSGEPAQDFFPYGYAEVLLGN